jgi:hypothetical protein
MTTLVPIYKPVKPLMQLVMFPELLGADALPLDACFSVAETPAQDPEERLVSVQAALAAGQLLLFHLA